MSLSREQMLKELELLPVWQLKNAGSNAGEGACATKSPDVVAQAPSPAIQPIYHRDSTPLTQGIHTRGYLPHLKAEGGIYAVTFRLSDSLPAGVVEQMAISADLTGDAQTGKGSLEQVQVKHGDDKQDEIDALLNAGHGECWLKQPQIAACVKDALLAKNGMDYQLHAWAIMPNHVHVVLEPLAGNALSDILQAIKSASAHHANALLQRSGPFWQRESYDHLIRDEEDFQRCCEYVRQNPVKAGLVTIATTYPLVDIYAGEGACATDNATPAASPELLAQPRLLAGDDANILVDAIAVAQVPSPASNMANAPIAAMSRAEGILHLDWLALQQDVPGCVACNLSQTRTQTVFGVGDPDADWLIIGEAPGAEEDRKGEPFVGMAGQLLDNMLAAIQLQRGRNVYIANVLKCRPPENRDPHGEEVRQCDPYLKRQVELIQPKLILALGKFAAQSLLDSTDTIAAMRGRQHSFQGVPVIVTYHPAYLLRNLPDKAKAWEDLCFARATMQALQTDESPQ